MVLVVSPQYAAQPFSDLGNRLMHPPAELLLEFSQFRPPSFAVRNAPDLEPASFGIRTDMFESQKGERLRFPFSTLGPVQLGEPPESNQLGLIFVQLQPVPPQMFPQLSEVPVRFVRMLES